MGAHSYLASLPLPEDSGLRVPFGLTREGGGAALRHNLVPGAHYKLGSSWTGREGHRQSAEWWNGKRQR